MTRKPYILGQVVARGGMAEVYRGLYVGQDGFRRMVAIKKILAHHAQNAEFTEMFKDEAHIGQRLQHMNIVKVEGFDIISGAASIIMEFVDGVDLRALLAATEGGKSGGKKQHLPIGLCLYIISEAARGLHYAHTRHDDVSRKPLNIVHRDISPQNILISWAGEVKVTDFGIAAADRDFKQTETKAGIVKGKYSYMSPEQISGKKCDAKTDIFALCVVLWEMLAMRRLFTAENEIEVIEMVRGCKIPMRLSELNPKVDSELEAIVMRGLAKEPRHRYESMDALEKTLRAYLTKSGHTEHGQELSTFVKAILSDKHEVSKEEIRKILTAQNQPDAAPVGPRSLHKGLELPMDAASKDTKSLIVGRSVNTSHSAIGYANRAPSTNAKSQSAYRQQGSGISRSVHRASRDKAGNRNTFIWLTAMIIFVIGGALLVKQQRRAAKKVPTLTIRVTPDPVRIKVNNMDMAGGRFLSSPVKVRLDPGLNSVDITRPGYKTESLLISTDDGPPKTPPVVQLSAATAFAPTRLSYLGTEAVTVNVNDGFFKQTLSAKQPTVQIADLTSAIPADLTVTNPATKKSFRCAFTPSGSTKQKPVIVTIDPSKNQCAISSAGGK